MLVYPNITHSPNNIISVYIRHGDKAREMHVYELKEYLVQAEQLITKLKLSRHIMLSTDDAKIINELETNLAKRQNFTFYYINTKFYRDDQQRNSKSYSLEVGKMKFTAHVIVNLLLSSLPTARAYITTLKSNFGRMIHEFMQTDGWNNQLGVVDLNQLCLHHDRC